ncbi:protease [Rhodoferax sp.]|uniref:protease n=1 Tax=Rhodoferax sp. TaxID=50421 RepID=UPI002ACED929|nr:protease [Rhodoferax sp.]MDZ7918509.1 protease [Rhodoferax sp.]
MKLKRFVLQEAMGVQASAGGSNTSATGANTQATDATATDTATAADTSGATQQTSTDATAPGDGKDGSDAAKPAVPEAYEFKFADGVTLDEDAAGEFTGLAKELGLTQDGAQKVADIGAKMAQKWATQQEQALMQAGDEWAAQTTSDPEIGGDKLDASLAAGKKALDELGTPELSALLKSSRLGNHPEVIRFFARVGAKVSGDTQLVTGQAAPAGKSDARRMYSASNMNP